MTAVLIRTTRPDAQVPPRVLDALSGRPGEAAPDDIVDQWGRQSFPASDPPANW